MLLNVNETRTLEVKGKKIEGFSFKFYCAAAVNNVAIDSTDLLLENTTVKCLLKRNGQQFVLFQDVLLPLAVESGFSDSSFYYSGAAGNGGKMTLLARASSVKEQVLLPLTINFGGIVDLRGNDEIELEVYFGGSTLSSDIASATSHLEFDVIEGSGQEFGTPYIRSKSIQAGESRLQMNIGDNVTAVSLINTDKTSLLTADQVCSTISMSSKETSLRDNYYELLAKRSEMFQLSSDADARAQNFRIYPYRLDQNEPLTSVTLDATLVAANVNTSKNYIVTRSFYTDGKLIRKAAIRERKEADVRTSRMLQR